MAVTKGGKLHGGSEILKNLGKEIGLIEGDIFKGLKLGLPEIQADATQRAPVEFGVLRGSSFTDVDRVRSKIKARVGFVAKYAPYVHEAPMTLKGQPRPSPSKGVFWQSGENKFLEKAVKEGARRLVAVIKRFAKR